MATTRPKLLSPRRTLLQGVVALLWLVLPLLRPDGVGMLRLDLPRLTLELGGTRFAIDDLFLLLLLTVVLVLLFLLLTLALGRVWCGWGCPQTALVDLGEGLARRLGIRVLAGTMSATPNQRLALQLGYLLLALVAGTSLVWYFVPPHEFFPRLLAGELDSAVTASLLGVATPVYLDLALLRRLVCREFCPYGRFQAALVDAGTLALRFHPDEAARCIRCGACVRACPVGIDIRCGEQIECINCGRCLDACRRVMHARGEAGIVRYTFGLTGQGLRALVNPRFVLLACATLAALTVFAAAALQRPAATLKFGRSAAPQRQLAGDRSAVFYTAYLQNRTATPQAGRLTITLGEDGDELGLLGPVTALQLAPGERRKLDFAVVFSAADNTAERFTLHLLAPDNRELARAEAPLPALTLPER